MTGTNNPIELLVSISADTVGSKESIKRQLEKLSTELKLDLGVKIDDNGFKKTETAIGNANKQYEKFVGTHNSFRDGLGKVASDADIALSRIVSGFERVDKSSQRTIKGIRDKFEGQDYTIKIDTDFVDDKNVLKGLQVDVKRTEDSIERITYKLKKVGKDGGVELVQTSLKSIDATAFNLSKNLNKTTDQLELLYKQGKLSASAFGELNAQANKMSGSESLDKMNTAIKNAVVSQKHLTDAAKTQESEEKKLQSTRQRTIDQLERLSHAGKISGSQASSFTDQAGAEKSIDGMNRLRQSIALTTQEYSKTSQASNAVKTLGNRIEDLTISTKLSSTEAEKWRSKYSSASTSSEIGKINRDLTVHLSTQKQVNAELQKQKNIQEQIRKLTNNIVSEQGRNPRAFGNNAEVNNMLTTLRGIDPAAKSAATSVKGVSDGFQRLKAESTEAGRSSMGVAESFKIAMEKFPIWMAASTAFYGTVRGIRDAVSQIIDIDSQMVILQRVTSGQSNVNDVLEESIRLAGELGNKIADVNEGFIVFARQGFRGEDLSKMAEYSTLLSNISDLSVEEGSGILTAGIKGFNIAASESIKIVDALNEVDNNFSITTKDLGTAMMRSAGAASTYGVSLEESIG